MNEKEKLQQQRHAKVEQMRAILLTAKAATRGLTADEQRQYNAFKVELDDLNLQLGAFAPATQAGQRSLDADDHRWRDGRAVGLRSQDRLSEYLERRGIAPPASAAAERVSFGELARAYITGNHDRLNDSERRALSASVGSAGGFMAPSPIAADVLDFARAQSRVMQAGALTVPMTAGTLDLAKITTGITPGWKEENAEGAESDAVFGAVTLATKTLHVHCYVGLELIEDAPNAADVVEREFTAAIASEFDRVALLGTGFVNQPQGLFYKNGVNVRTLGAGNGATPTDYDFLIDAIGDVWSNHGEPSAILYASRTATVLAKLKEAVNLQPLRVPDVVAAVPRLVTNQVPINQTVGSSTDCSCAFTGDFRQLAIGIRVGFEFAVSRDAGDAFKKGQVMVRGRLRGDVGVLRAAQFTVTKGIRG